MFLDLLVNGIFQGVAISVAALGFATIWYASKEFHFLYGVMLAASGFGVYVLVRANVNLVLAIAIVVLVAALVGAILEDVFYRRLGSPLSVLLFSFGLATILQNVLQIIFGPQDVVLPHNDIAARSVTVVPFANITRGSYGLFGIPRPTFFGVQLNNLAAFTAFVVAVGAACWLVLWTCRGLTTRSPCAASARAIEASRPPARTCCTRRWSRSPSAAPLLAWPAASMPRRSG